MRILTRRIKPGGCSESHDDDYGYNVPEIQDEIEAEKEQLEKEQEEMAEKIEQFEPPEPDDSDEE